MAKDKAAKNDETPKTTEEAPKSEETQNEGTTEESAADKKEAQREEVAKAQAKADEEKAKAQAKADKKTEDYRGEFSGGVLGEDAVKDAENDLAFAEEDPESASAFNAEDVKGTADQVNERTFVRRDAKGNLKQVATFHTR